MAEEREPTVRVNWGVDMERRTVCLRARAILQQMVEVWGM